jgi:hypothetical protein
VAGRLHFATMSGEEAIPQVVRCRLGLSEPIDGRGGLGGSKAGLEKEVIRSSKSLMPGKTRQEARDQPPTNRG